MSSVSTPGPVENPALTAAIAAFSLSQSLAHRETLFRELVRATYLVPILEGQVSIRPGTLAGEQVIEPGSRFQTLICQDPESGEELLPIFSDLQELRSFTDQQVSMLVLELPEVHELLGSERAYAGAVVNPSGVAIPMSRELLAQLVASAKRR